MRAVLVILVFFIVASAILFGSAGRVDLPFFWGVIGISMGFMLVNILILDPELRKERLKPGAGGISRKFRVMMTPLILGCWVIAGLDVGRFHWADTVPVALRWIGLVGLAAAMVLTLWATRTNRFFSPVIRVQAERGHHVIDTGPYALIRHPGYAATVTAFLCGALAFGSWIAVALTIPYAALVAHRTLIEERFLRENLPGYGEYLARVRSRWIPGIW
jgi:protein-S-isoprenylcysteine O-methyltransferase Ste14